CPPSPSPSTAIHGHGHGARMMRATSENGRYPYAGGEETAERSHKQRLFHTVSTSTPTEKRLARIRPRDAAIKRAALHRTECRTLLRQQQPGELHAPPSVTSDFQDSSQGGSVHSSRLSWSSSGVRESVVSRVATLKALFDQGFISEEEYERRKCAVIDELTYASNPSMSTRLTITQPSRVSFGRMDGTPLIVPHPPDFKNITPEVATKHVFDYEKRQWSSTEVYVALDEVPFSKGSLRVVYHLQDLNEVGYEGSYVAKLAIDPDEDPQTYFRDIELQAHCARYARLYNSYNPPKRVQFIKAWVLELTERNGTLCAVEPYIPGEYCKHNNNFGCVSDDERNTPQAFSHFTYEASNHELLAVDIQGVGDKYTDPQIHTLNGDDFGKGNLGALGFQKFLSSHRCNSICRYLKLPQVNPKERHADCGTLPLQELMNKDRIRPAHFDSKHYYENAPMLQKYLSQCRELEETERRRMEDNSSLPPICSKILCGCAIQ
ncbi:TPA: hypothetical protein N0F65_009400, partial [Lagenidium giganteum]